MTEVMISFGEVDERMWLVTANCAGVREQLGKERFQQILKDAGL